MKKVLGMLISFVLLIVLLIPASSVSAATTNFLSGGAHSGLMGYQTTLPNITQFSNSSLYTIGHAGLSDGNNTTGDVFGGNYYYFKDFGSDKAINKLKAYADKPLRIYLFDSSGNQLTMVTASANTLMNESINITNARYYVVNVNNANNAWIYTLEANYDDSIVNLPTAPQGLTGISSNALVSLEWGGVSGATSYNVKRSTNQGGPYTTIGTGITGTNYNDTTVINGNTYYYVVYAVNSGGESGPSNEASATPQADETTRALLTLYLTGGQVKEYDLSAAELDSFLTWFDNRAENIGPAKYAFNKTWNKGPFKTRKEYVIFSKIDTFDVDEYEVTVEE